MMNPLTCLLLSTLLVTGTAATASNEVSDKAPGFHVEPSDPAAVKALADKPVTTMSGPAGDLLKKWYAEKTAAGNVGDVYDNRDRGHSGLDLGQFPQLSKTVYNEQALKYRVDWAATLRRVPLVLFGNSSTSAGATAGGSNPRMMYTRPGGLRALYAQYTSNNLYIYPEHCDYKPGHNGTPGYGDLYPTNTPFVFISQGSSGSDQPFMRAAPLTLAALRPEVKQKLAQNGLLMPAIQMIFRSTARQLSGPQDYLTGKAHPPVFDGAWVDPLAMVRMAHEITAEAIPPMVQLSVLEEDVPVPGRDYFEPSGRSEELGTTPAVVARVWRGRDCTRRMLVSAANSFDRNRRPLEFHWILLRGDPAKISIKTLTARRAAPRFLSTGTTATRSPLVRRWNRIGSTSAFSPITGSITRPRLSSLSSSWTARRELTIRTGDCWKSATGPARWTSRHLTSRPCWRPTSLTRPCPARRRCAAYSAEQTKIILAAAGEYRRCHAAWQTAVKDRENAEKTHKPEKEIQRLREAESAAQKAEQQTLGGGQDVLHATVGDAVLGPLRAMAADPYLFRTSGTIAAEVLRAPAQKTAFRSLSEQFVHWGLFREAADSPEKLVLVPLRKSAATDPAALTRFEKDLLRRFHGEWLGRFVYPALASFPFRNNYVDPNISAPKSWRDIYHYDAKGACTGWTRRDEAGATEFAAAGKLVLEKDAAGGPRKMQAVRYEQDPLKFDAANPPRGPNWNVLRWKVKE